MSATKLAEALRWWLTADDQIDYDAWVEEGVEFAREALASCEAQAEAKPAQAHQAEPAPAVEPTEPGWYVVLPPDFDKPTIRAFGKDHQWWIPLGKGNGEDGWVTGRPYKNWVGPIATIDDEQPFRAAPAAPAPAGEEGK